MINRIMKWSGESAYVKDLTKLDESVLSSDIKQQLNVRYADDDIPDHILDVYYRDDGSLKPVLIDVHGGGFISYHKEFDRVFANVMAQKGFVVFELEFRLAYPEYTVFDQISDIDKAARWVQENAHEYGGDAGRMYIAGHSSGCVLATSEALLSIDQEMLSAYGFAERTYQYKGMFLDCGLLHFYKNSIAYNGMRRMVFPKRYKGDKRFKYLVFKDNDRIEDLPRTALITNRKDVLKAMTYFHENVLSSRNVEHRLFDKGDLGHTGIVFKPYDEFIDEPVKYLL